ncbi:hypothetical protein QTP88_028611 [Uroleucon formosanum]
MSMDGWSNIHNEPVVCISVYDVTKKAVYLVETIDPQDNSHNSEYLLNLAVEAISNCQKYNCTVQSFVTDNAANMAKMREELAQIDEIGAVNNNVCDIITYGCSAHILNLLAHDLEVDSIKSNIKQVIKYFRNSHKIGAKYKQAGGKTLILPSDVRWNTFSDCLQSYLENWHILSSVCSNNRAAIDTTIIRKIEDMEMKRNAEDYFRKLKMISISLDKIQKYSCTLSDAIDVWKDLLKFFEKNCNLNEVKKLKDRYDMAVTPPHFLANMLDPKHNGSCLSEEESDSALQYIYSYHPNIMAEIISYQAQCGPFKPYLFHPDTVKSISPMAWWSALFKRNLISVDLNILTMHLFTAVCSSAGIERLFSSFGFIHSKSRSRLGVEKCSKLVTIFKHLNKTRRPFSATTGDYFEDTWLGKTVRKRRRGPTFPLEMWNCYDAIDLPKTNNSVEGWNGGFNHLLGSCHPTLWKLIEGFKQEQTNTEMKVEQYINGQNPIKKKEKISRYCIKKFRNSKTIYRKKYFKLFEKYSL